MSRSKQVRPWEHQLWTLPGEQLHHEQVVKDNQEHKYPVEYDKDWFETAQLIDF